MNQDEIRILLEDLTGQAAPITNPLGSLNILDSTSPELGCSQLNELLLLFGFDRITHAFFRFLLDGKTEYEHGQAFSSAEQLRAGVDRFRELAVLLYGNVKFAFKTLSQDAALLTADLESKEPVLDTVFSSRHLPVLPIQEIAPDDAYLTGYLIEREINERLTDNPADSAALALKKRRDEVVRKAAINHIAYLASDHLDVYVATSMRERHEFSAIQRLVSDIFAHAALAPLKLRWFDPTQAVCPHRIDKGLSEGLMLRRATCTIYLAQESDTLGKDSELASTLAQGKPVVAYIPQIDTAFIQQHLAALKAANPNQSEAETLLKQLELFDSGAAWRDPQVREWCTAPTSIDRDALLSRLEAKMSAHYEKRAQTLKESHPLGIQVNLATGVANGVLVVRTVATCAQLVRNIVTHKLEFDLIENTGHTELRERISGCIFRVVTRDEMLTNTFWNFYLDPAE